MKLLILTQKVDNNDPVLGFFHRWIEVISRSCERVTVICLSEGEHSLPSNVFVLSLGKEKNASRWQYLWRFYKYIWRERANYDNVFVHMNQVYVILGGFLWKIWNKKIGFWYAHGKVFFGLRVAEMLSDIIFTSTAKGFRLASPKVRVVGQGIDVDFFNRQDNLIYDPGRPFRMITVSRISPVKDFETVINALDILNKNGIQFVYEIIGDVGLDEQRQYLQLLKKLIAEKRLSEKIIFTGAVENRNIGKFLINSDLFINASRTGSLDKAMLEAMSSKTIVLSCNESFVGLLKPEQRELFTFGIGDAEELAKKIETIIRFSKEERVAWQNNVRSIVVENHNLQNLISKIIHFYE